MSKIKTAVRVLTGNAAITASAEPIRTPHGLMLPGPEYDRYAEARAYQEALESLLVDLESFSINKAEALERIAALNGRPDFTDHVANLRTALEAPPQAAQGGGVNLTTQAQLTQAMARVREWLSPLRLGVSSYASKVPRPIDPNAPKRDPGQRLGTGWAASQ